MGFLAAIPAAFEAVASATATAAQIATVAATTATVASTAAAGYTAYSAHQQAAYQAQVSQNNAKIASMNSDSTLEQGAVQESVSREQTTARIGGALAAQGANGLDVGFGTDAGVREGLQGVGDLDALTIRYNASQRALGFATQGMNFEAESAGYKAAGTNALIAGGINMGTSVLSGASSLANQNWTNSLFSSKSSAPTSGSGT